MIKTAILVLSMTIAFTSAGPAGAFFKVPDTLFSESLEGATQYPTESLNLKFNYKENTLVLGAYTGTWKNRKSSKGGGLFRKRDHKTSTDILLESSEHGRWEMLCSGSLKGFGLTFEKDDNIDYRCAMSQGEAQILMTVSSYKKPKFALGQTKQERAIVVTLADGTELSGQSIHQLVGTKTLTKPPAGYEIRHDDEVIGGLGRIAKKQVILVAEDVDVYQNTVFMIGLGLYFFEKNNLEKAREMDF